MAGRNVRKALFRQNGFGGIRGRTVPSWRTVGSSPIRSIGPRIPEGEVARAWELSPLSTVQGSTLQCGRIEIGGPLVRGFVCPLATGASALSLRPVVDFRVLVLSGGTEVANVCGFFGPNYTRRLSFGMSATCGGLVTLLIPNGPYPVERALVRFG